MKLLFLPVLFALAGPAFASCPMQPDQSVERDALLANIRAAEGYSDASQAVGEMWQFWLAAPDEPAQELLEGGLAGIRYADYLKAESELLRLVEYCPDYAEGHNQLAYALFLQEKDDKSAVHLERALEIEPNHFGALSGLGLIHTRGGKPALAQIYIRRAVAINPWLNERHLLQPLPEEKDL